MAAPFNLEDLAKLKSFVEFVAANPAILNMPQLDFLKKLIEQLGGKVPEGSFQMPAGAKCPFGGDVKSESKFTPPPASADEDEEEIPEMEVESEESEVELDMEANNRTVIEPNIVYLDEKPPQIVKTKRDSTLKKSFRRTATDLRSKRKQTKKGSVELREDYIVKKERRSSEDNQGENNEPYDPLYTAKLEVKCELNEHSPNDSNDYENEEPKDNEFVAENNNSHRSKKMMQRKLERSEDDEFDEEDDADDDEDDDDDDDDNVFDGDDDDDLYDDNEMEADEDEPLIMLTRRKGRSRKKPARAADDGSRKTPRSVDCHEICKQRCAEKFSEPERKSICDYFWNLGKEERLDFIRKHTRVRRLTRMKRVNAIRSRGSSFCYYLKNYSIGRDETIPDLSSDLIRVCRKFFEATLCTTNHYIKKASDGSIQEIEKDLILLHEIKLAKERVQEKVKEPKQILDPETGNLITLDGKTKPTQKAKQKRVRRKPGDPEPEHFPKPIKCFHTCIHKCHIKFNEDERKKICDFFWSMDYKRRKDFVLAHMEIKDIESETTPDFRKTNRPPRAYQSRFYMRSGGTRGEKVRVCKDFFTKTLLVNRYFIKNAIEFADKTTGCYTGTDRRGVHEATNKISDDRKQKVMDHIESYPFWIPNKKSKTRYLHHSLTIKKMFDAYKEKCFSEKTKNINVNYYYKVFHDDFQILFLSNPQPKKGWGLLRSNPNISHYTGNEAGGYWIDSKGNKLDLRSIDPTLSLDVSHQQNLLTNNASTHSSSAMLNPFASSSDARAPNIAFSAASVLPLKTLLNPQSSMSILKTGLEPGLEAFGGSLAAVDSANMLKML